MVKREKTHQLIAICGRTNVGKSTLFNCLTEKSQALVSPIAGTTRDSNLGTVDWANQHLELVDTAGIIDHQYLANKKKISDDLDSQTQSQARTYLDQSDLILFLVDNKVGLLPEDKEIAAALKRNPGYTRKTILVANKVDSFKQASEASVFNKLGLGEPLIISAASGLGTGDLLDFITNRLKSSAAKKNTTKKDEKLNLPTINACVIGKPNVGKSSLLNAILGYERVIVSPIPHTTREPQNTEITYKDKAITLVDTAGISKQGKKGRGLEKPGILKSLKSLEKADVALLVIDISEPITHQDAKIIQEIVERQKSLIFIANKWDQVENRNTKNWTTVLYDKLPFAAWAPLQFVSAKTGEKINKILDLVLQVAEQRKLELSYSQCTKFLNQIVKLHKPAKGKGVKAPRIYEMYQTKSNPPRFTVRIGSNDDLHFSYLRFLENRLRDRYGFTGTPIHIAVTKHRKSHTTYND